MYDMLSRIIDIENVFSAVDSGDIYKIGIDFFSLMNYPVKKLDKVVNSKLDSFLAYHTERRVQFSPYEYEYLRNIRSISGLFTLIEKDAYSGATDHRFWSHPTTQSGLMRPLREVA